MTELVADTSALVSLGTAVEFDRDPLTVALRNYEVQVPETVLNELEDVASYDDEHGQVARAVLARTDETIVRAVPLDSAFPLDDGENAAVTLANDVDAALLLCDEFRRLGLVHASLANTRLVTTPTLLSVFVRTGLLSREEAVSALETIARARSWNENSYVRRARSLLDD